jgi:hypothetical protein
MTKYTHVHEGSCDCGAVRFEYHCQLALAQHTARACQCEFCKPRQATYLSVLDAELHIHLKDVRYLYAHRFGTNTADFMHCAVCNEQVFARTEVDGRQYALVYAPALENFSQLLNFSEVDYQGELVGNRIQRRADNWIPNLMIHSERDH